MELFRENGHLSEAGLHAVAGGGLAELQRLEAAEHLAFCDECLVRYVALLKDDDLLAPPAPLKPAVMKRLKNRPLRVAFGRYGTVAAAAVLAAVLWGAGSRALPQLAAIQPPAPAAQAPSSGGAGALVEGIGRGVDAVGGYLRGWFGAASPAAQPPPQPTQSAPPPAAADDAEKAAREAEDKEEVFRRPQPADSADSAAGG